MTIKKIGRDRLETGLAVSDCDGFPFVECTGMKEDPTGDLGMNTVATPFPCEHDIVVSRPGRTACALFGVTLLATLLGVTQPASAADLPGVTATEIKIGNTDAYSGPASAYGVIAKTETAFFQMVNDQGGVAGHKINFISYDDAYSPPKTVEQVRRLIEEDQVAFLFQNPGNAAEHGDPALCEHKKCTASVHFDRRGQVGRLSAFPLDDGLSAQLPDRGQIYTKYMMAQKPGAKLGILYQNDDFGKDYPARSEGRSGRQIWHCRRKGSQLRETDARWTAS